MSGQAAHSLVQEIQSLRVENGSLVVVRVDERTAPPAARRVWKSVHYVVRELCIEAGVLVVVGDVQIECLSPEDLASAGLCMISREPEGDDGAGE